MRVAFDHQIFSLQRYGGISRYFFEIACRLPVSTVTEVAVIAPVHINYYLSRSPARGFVRGVYIPYTFRGYGRVTRALNTLAVPLAWRGLRPDIIHETFFSRTPVGHGRRRVITVYDMIHELFPEEFSNAAQVCAAKRAAIERADHVICISESTKKDLIRMYGLDASRTSVVHLGHSLVESDLPAMFQSAVRKPVILYVGNRAGYKNFDRVIQAFASSALLRSEFEIVAFGGPPFSAMEKTRMGHLGVERAVTYRTGSDADLAALYKTAVLLVYPSIYEGFGIPPIEAMSWGCPVVCSDRSSIPEVVGDAGILFDPYSVEAICAALERVASTAEVQSDLRARGHRRMRLFSWEKCAAETARIYQSVC